MHSYSSREKSRSPHGERGLKLVGHAPAVAVDGRSPHGERGLKPKEFADRINQGAVAPRMGSVG